LAGHQRHRLARLADVAGDVPALFIDY
jgi:hypothetical protein